MYEKLDCPCCNSIVSRCNFPKHQKTKKCLSKQTNHKVGELMNQFIKLKENEKDFNKETIEKHLNELYEKLLP